MAAVAMVFAGPPDALDLCFILRATREGDRWSGQMAFPGGRAELQDPTAEAVAMRETQEEVGLNLSDAESLGPLPPVSLRPMGGPLGVLAPSAFHVGQARPTLTPNDGEVERAYWIPVSHLWDPQHNDTIDWDFRGQPLRFSGIRFGDHVIWGLTYRVLAQLGGMLQRPLPAGSPTPKLRPSTRGDDQG